jgi:hypothetical protein
MIKKYNKLTDGQEQLTTNFQVWEFECKAAAEVLIDDRLPEVLQTIRGLLERPVRVNSGYRSPEYNSTVPGAAKNSQHILGTAADIGVSGVTPLSIARAAEKALAQVGIQGGIGLYDTFVHVDVRDKKARWETSKATGGKETSRAGWDEYADYPTLKRGDSGGYVKKAQEALNRSGVTSKTLEVDGRFGADTDGRTREFQSSNGLVSDGMIGQATWPVLMR